jgi:hypothetical protein
MNIDCHNNQLHVHQTQYIKRKLKEFGLANERPASCPLNPKIYLCVVSQSEINILATLNVNYRALIGLPNYLSVLTRPDILFAVSVLSQHLEKPGIQHYEAAQQFF